MSKWPDPTPGICDNCGASLYGDYCHLCGQYEKSYIRSVFSVISEFMQEFSSWDSRVLRTLVPLMFRPAFLSNEYVAGRRVRYVPPIRLYLFVSLVFFLVLAFVARVDTAGWTEMSRQAQAAGQQAELPPLPDCRPGSGIQIRGDDRRPLAERVCVSVRWFSDETNERLRRQIVRVGETPELAFQQARQLAPVMMFLLLPVFAFILKVLYLFSKRYYTEHLTLALHTHSFLFLSFLLLMAFGAFTDWAEAGGHVWLEKPAGFISAALLIWMPVYLWLSQKRFYRQGFFMTSFKYCATGFLYMCMVSFTLLILVFASVLIA